MNNFIPTLIAYGFIWALVTGFYGATVLRSQKLKRRITEING
jgi:hypothetical protein